MTPVNLEDDQSIRVLALQTSAWIATISEPLLAPPSAGGSLTASSVVADRAGFGLHWRTMSVSRLALVNVERSDV